MSTNTAHPRRWLAALASGLILATAACGGGDGEKKPVTAAGTV